MEARRSCVVASLRSRRERRERKQRNCERANP
jgi:hypothetical protein